MTLLDEVAGARRPDGVNEPAGQSAVAEIAEALFELGGSAHREVVIDRIAIRRGHPGVSDSLRAELVAAFDRHRLAAAREDGPALLHLPFGEGSRRWSLTREALQGASAAQEPSAAAMLLSAAA